MSSAAPDGNAPAAPSGTTDGGCAIDVAMWRLQADGGCAIDVAMWRRLEARIVQAMLDEIASVYVETGGDPQWEHVLVPIDDDGASQDAALGRIPTVLDEVGWDFDRTDEDIARAMTVLRRSALAGRRVVVGGGDDVTDSRDAKLAMTLLREFGERDDEEDPQCVEAETEFEEGLTDAVAAGVRLALRRDPDPDAPVDAALDFSVSE